MKTFIFLLFSGTLVTQAVGTSSGEPIPGTKLFTKMSYKIHTRDFGGVVTYTADKGKLDGYSYVQTDYGPNSFPNYNPGGKWFKDALWEFIPVTSDGEQWYKLRNLGDSVAKNFLTFSDREFVEDPGQTNFVVLYDNANGIRSENDFLVKPVAAKLEGLESYQLKLKELPKAVVTYSAKRYRETETNRYIMVDNSRDQERMQNYSLGPKGPNVWYKSTLFSFDHPIYL